MDASIWVIETHMRNESEFLLGRKPRERDLFL